MIDARDYTTIDFIKSYVINEQKPTCVIINKLCWSSQQKVKLAVEISKAGFRLSETPVLTTEYLYHNLLFLLDFDCANAPEVVYDAISRKLFASPFRWLMLSSSLNVTSFSLVLNSPILPDSDVVLAERIRYGFKLTEIHRTSLSGFMVYKPRGYYDGTMVDIRPHREMYRRRKNVMGHTLTMANVIQDSNTTQYHLPREDRL
ncbi:unnamed protein product [Diatraea saccharalis]|uniref:Uncharacterized protein n=1 Tax=Diatraea saccharalis TaxID=40085 RepID=A0A9N9RFV5_9NEOP|nr:unnamed protein product [Diatraea saccharalis]